MILLNTGSRPRHELAASPHAGASVQGAVWIDLRDPTDAERGLVEQAIGLRVPSQAELSEIESSSRLSARDDVLTLSTPIVSRADHEAPVVSPLGFVLARDRLLTVRYTDLRAFDSFADRFCDLAPGKVSGGAAFVGLMEAVIDRLADILEQAGADMDRISRRIFSSDTARSGPRRADAELRLVLRDIGRIGELTSKLRDSLLGIGRILGYVKDATAEWMPANLQGQIHTLQTDLQSLSDYDSQLTNKVQFLLDATLGFINIQQNNIIKVLTVASIAGIPPTLIAGIYGMNFANIPELKWAYGYPYSLILMLLSGVLPVLWMRRKGWL